MKAPAMPESDLKMSSTGKTTSGDTDTIVGCVLAGGLSRRMGGGDKSLIPVDGTSMMTRVMDRLSPQVGRVIINANGDPNRFASYERPVVPDPIEGFAGPLAGILAGLLWTRANMPTAAHVLTVAADTPFFPLDLAQRFKSRCARNDTAIVLAASGGKQHPVFGYWPVGLADDLQRWLAENQSRKVLHWVERHPNLSESFDELNLNGTRLDPFFNANTPEDIELANTLAGAMAEKEKSA